jgi:hypothetical protein
VIVVVLLLQGSINWSSLKQTFRIGNKDSSKCLDVKKLERVLKVKKRQKEEAMNIENTQRLFEEIEILKMVLVLVHRYDRESA